MARGTNGAATIIGSSRQNLGNLECWGLKGLRVPNGTGLFDIMQSELWCGLQTLSGATMGLIKLLAAPIRSIARFPLFQLAVVVFVIFVLQAADDKSAFGQLFNGLDKAVDLTVTSLSAVFNVKSFTKSLLTFSFMIAYVYVAFFLILALTRFLIRIAVDLVGQSNAFWLRNTIARERGIAAYRAWVPFDKIRPADIRQEEWEERFAWPANDKPPYPPLAQRMVRRLAGYVVVFLVVIALLETLTSFPVVTWFGELLKMLRF
jgi:hypothetical protein